MAVLRLLGPVEIETTSGWVGAGTPKRGCILAALALSAPVPLSVAELTQRVWGAEPPESAASVIYGHISRLRTLLRDCAGGITLMGGRARGYVLTAGPADVDLLSVRRLVERARARTDHGDFMGALDLWRQACASWDGSFLVGVNGRWAERMRDSIRTEYLAMLSGRYSSELAAGNHSIVIAQLSELVAAMPYAEQLVGQLMLALYREGRTAEALDLFVITRHNLIEDLGIEPGAELGTLHQSILRKDPAISGPEGTGVWAGKAVLPAQLPADTAVFTGREEQIAQLCSHAHASLASHGAGPVVTVVHGMAGVGKTALAVRAGRQLSHLFPDGQVFLDLHGFTPGTAPVRPADALDRILRSLGTAPTEIPTDTEDRAALYRSVLRGRRCLIVLDNAADEIQVQPLLPSHPGSCTIVTSRRPLHSLYDVAAVPLEILHSDQAVDLFAKIAHLDAGLRTVREKVREVVEYCGRLPLAIRIAATRLRSRPDWTLETLLRKLRSEDQRLSVLQLGDRRVATAFDASYRSLPDDERLLFRLLGLNPGVSFTVPVAAALMDQPAAEAEEWLASLTEASMVVCDSTQRYRLHDLLRQYAAHLAANETDDRTRRAARKRLYDLFRTAAYRAHLLLDPFANRVVSFPESPHALEIADRQHAHSWWQAEWVNIYAAIVAAPGQEVDEHLIYLAKSMWCFLNPQYYLAEAISVATIGIHAAQRLGNSTMESALLNQRGVAHKDSTRYGEALDDYRASFALRRADDFRGRAGALNNIGIVYNRMGRFAEAVQSFEAAIDLSEARVGADLVALAHVNITSPLLRLGRVSEVPAHLDIAAATFERLGHDVDLARVDYQRGDVARRSGDLGAALEFHRRVLATTLRMDEPRGQALARNAIGCDLREMGELDAAADSHEQALSIVRKLSDKELETEILNDRGRTLEAMGRNDEAIVAFREAVAIARTVHSAYDLAVALHGLADVLSHAGRIADAEPVRREAQDLYRDCGVPETA